jgi:hypothetical protein
VRGRVSVGVESVVGVALGADVGSVVGVALAVDIGATRTAEARAAQAARARVRREGRIILFLWDI